jgi:ribose/xylose/arabinose/galactoside ABC-type transport system permease subunit
MYPPPSATPYPLPHQGYPPYWRPRQTVPALVPHLVWEAVLLLMVVAVVGVAAARTPIFGSDGIWWSLAIAGLLASGLGLSLRTGTPNLAVAGIAGVAGMLYAVLVVDADLPALLAVLVALVAATLIGGLLGLIAGLTSVPAWAVSLAGLALVQGITLAAVDPSGRLVPGDVRLLNSGITWFVVFVLLSLAGGAILAVPPIRRLVTGRTDTERVRAGGSLSRAGLVSALVGFGGSSLLAGGAGVLMVVQVQALVPASFSLFPLLLALAAALIGGTSGFGGRGGIAGTVLGVMLVTVGYRWIEFELRAQDDRSLSVLAGWLVVALAILAGIGVSRALVAIAPVGPDDPAPAAPQPPVTPAPQPQPQPQPLPLPGPPAPSPGPPDPDQG